VEVVLRNLIANAVDAVQSRPDARIEVRLTREENSHMRIIVADNGPGVPESKREEVFEPFVSGKATGMGLGLAMSRAIAEAHGGSLEARTGGEFHLVLPCQPTR
jgi:C4-dicarboxylate-specific signal transduction histidine kinase